MKCIAIDDEPLALKLLTYYCSQLPSIQLLGAYTDPVEGISYIRSMQPDLIFLDVCMPDISGVNIAQILQKGTMVIFTTAHREYAVDGFELDVVDYLLKPFDFERFLKACGKAEERFLAAQQKNSPQQISEGKIISFKYNYQNMQLPLHAILYVEAANNYIKIVTAEKTYMPVMTMKAVEALLPASDFVRIHKSFIVAAGKIKSFNSTQVVIEGQKLPVGRRYLREFMGRMERFKNG
ncbi:MAG: LytTR family DNA-binding domain-containing protein [Dysgonamonadaceae bacterium]|jgi:DNA-binding LytR/AlgR family response regulator|nr:LytTR family DNA-binding domain-containing protein [Dysgonamonadaceae bacterium]